MNKSAINIRSPMPDVAMDHHEEPQGTIDWVGMSEISAPLRFRDEDKVTDQQCAIQVYVNLTDAHAKGIHMSRLYRTIGTYETDQALTPVRLAHLLDDLQASHNDVSTKSYIEFRFDYVLKRSALVTDHSGWNKYPVYIRGSREGSKIVIDLEFWVHYSSTCPASAALSRQAIQHQFDVDFDSDGLIDKAQVFDWLGSSHGIVATPHGQRSVAKIHTKLDERLEYFPITSFIDSVENALGTPVQTAVRRKDEQEFAIRNGQNPMFCEDAVRRLKDCLDREERILDFLVRVEHYESLHAHNAVAIATKGITDGFSAIP
ncbi:MAG: GTP cyclohydrolase FolE2 [Gammaproteobacteria bacterium]|nr:GTP cyclohydrolase FolE2 [Gammaproteobacteria bacterium]